ncbi:MAG: O-antigen ligase family protein [Candidatus Omnitrophica bacterium]|nr:O-antigen ligase family protein [Candidatus Omnitrophota bacterium]
MVTFSRAGYLAFVVGSAAAVFFRKKILFLLLLIGFWLVWQNPDYLPSGVRYRLGQTIVKQQETATQTAPIENSLEQSARTRVGVWKGALWMIRDHPIMGVGYNLFETKITHYWVGGSIDAHNTYLLIASEMGVPALLIFSWILAAMFWIAYRLYRSSTDSFSRAVALGFIGGMFGFLVSNLFGSRLDSHEVSSYFWILAALVARLKLMEESKVNS